MASSEKRELTPDLIADIRHALGLTTVEFGDEVGVVAGTVRKWEAGETEPAPKYREEIWALVPDDVDVDNLGAGVLWSDALPLDERRLYGSEKLQTLRQQPSIASEFDGLQSLSPNQRQFVERLDVTGVQGSTKRSPEAESVYYLIRDERRAMRRFIEENKEFVASAMATKSNKLSAEWDDFHYQLLLDEWRFYLSTTD